MLSLKFYFTGKLHSIGLLPLCAVFVLLPMITLVFG